MCGLFFIHFTFTMLDNATIGKFHFSIGVTLVYLIFFMCLLLCCYLARRNKPWMEFSRRNVLLITAHPDDECMFFGPFISDAVKTSSSFSLLCLTKGDYYNEGEVRKQELLKSCRILGVKNITTLDNRKIPDDPTNEWNEGLVSEIVIRHVQNHNIDSIVTFDGHGVSGHVNHTSIYKGVKKLVDQRSIPYAIPVYTLDSVRIFRKYIFILDVLWSFLTRKLVFVSDLKTLLNTQNAMAAHRSQYVWFRRLYILFSRYMVVNTLTQIWGDPVEERKRSRTSQF